MGSFGTSSHHNSWVQPAENLLSTRGSIETEILQPAHSHESDSQWNGPPRAVKTITHQWPNLTLDDSCLDVEDIPDRRGATAPISAAKFATFLKMLSMAERRQVYNVSVESGTRVLDLFCGGIEAAFGKLALGRENRTGMCTNIKPNFGRIIAQGIPMFLASMPTKQYGLLYRAPYGADVRLNHIHIKSVYFLAAAYTNCRALGYDFNDFLDEDAVSPLVNGEEGSTEAQAVSRRFSNVPKDLRPTPIQIQRPHHLYIDLLPFPAFREKIITAAYTEPPILDEEEFCIDLLGDGMLCYGSSKGGVGTPWDKRNWDPQPWFLEKYWFLVGDKDDEMWSAARWWQSMRGED
ncbi:hypothetical protein PVAG01_01661 [Phlyctema vagabunda]|uniref:Uncharacterized protein n=1 Tax=Phlyctema vagabunda TaxID=108571 RepID=A0ABR4PYE2_9HELO